MLGAKLFSARSIFRLDVARGRSNSHNRVCKFSVLVYLVRTVVREAKATLTRRERERLRVSSTDHSELAWLPRSWHVTKPRTS